MNIFMTRCAGETRLAYTKRLLEKLEQLEEANPEGRMVPAYGPSGRAMGGLYFADAKGRLLGYFDLIEAN